ncbi:competence protein ComEA [Clostridium cavendishii DSM 21758]|uniref:Competence protein ComEA n=1 Tax=Clostridium cavendishii DSM 21758 TaxID=1121302 RepID=A0A1M6BHM0_9CLOT|nr:ComEA family DNA-binding protein [Clostridium cavendishii]SHI48088.1 competence protein ComEA [Clostridium cavendishii DSM 21758]
MKLKNKEKIIGAIIIGVIALVFLTVGYYTTRPQKLNQKDMEEIFVDSKVNKDNSNNKTKEGKENKKDKATTEDEFITVEIKGAVKKPDVYKLKKGANVKELIEVAGGLTEDGDDTNINRATVLKNEQCIVVVSKNNQNSNKIQNNKISNNILNNDKQEKRINLNSATIEELDSLPGVGKVTAEKIVEYRESKGGFKTIEELKNIGGLGDKKIDKFRDKIDVK